MKKISITTCLLALSSTLLWTACEDKSADGAPDAPGQVDSGSLEQASATALTDAVAKLLTQYPQIELADAAPKTQDPIVQEDGTQLILAQVPLRVREQLLRLEETPRVLNELRKSSNDAINQSMRPDAGYLMQVGAPSSVLIDEDRQPKPLPPELKSLAQKLKELAEESVYVVMHEKDAVLNLEAKIRLSQSPNKVWVINSVDIDDRPLYPIKDGVRASAQDSSYVILTPDWLEKRKAAISTLSEQFKQAAAPYIARREDLARELLLTRVTNYEEQRRAVIEKATQKEQERQQRKQRIIGYLKDGTLYQGEWLRGSQFGKLTLQINKAEIFDDAIQFVGSIYDTDLPEARLDVAGRADLTDPDKGAAVNVTIYDGQYDPDQPTAEVYDAKDGALLLMLNDKNKMDGVMTCTSWGKDSERNFTIKLAPPGEALTSDGVAPSPIAPEDAPDAADKKDADQKKADKKKKDADKKKG